MIINAIIDVIWYNPSMMSTDLLIDSLSLHNNLDLHQSFNNVHS